MAYTADQFDWLTRTWAQQLLQSLGDGTFADYLDTECINDPAAAPAVGSDEAFEILTAETTNILQNFVRECHQAFEGARAFRLRTTAGGGTALSIGSIADGQTVVRSGSSLIGASGVLPGTHASSHLPGGSDALTTANTATLSDNTSSAGSAASFLRSDVVIPHGNLSGGSLHALAVAGVSHGFISSTDQSKLDGVAAGAGTDTTLYSVDFTGLADNSLSGAETIDGRSWTATNAANATLFEILNSFGLHFDASTNNNTFNTSFQTGPYIVATWAAFLGSDYDPCATYALWWRVGTSTLAVNNNSIRAFVTSSGTFADLAHLGYQRTGGNLGFTHGGAGASSTSHHTAGGYGTGDVMVLIVSHNLCRSYVGTWSSGWPTKSSLLYVGANTAGVGANADESGFLADTGQFGMAFMTGETGGTMDALIRNFRIERVRG